MKNSSTEALRISAYILITLALSACTALNRDSNSQFVRISFGGTDIQFSVPDGQSLDFPPVPVRSIVDPYDLDLNSDRNTVTVSKNFWDFGPRLFGVDGTLGVELRIRKVASEFPADVSSIEALAMYASELHRRLGKNQIRPTGVSRFGSADWVTMEFSTKPQRVFAYPISESHFLEFRARYIDNDSGDSNRWHGAADALVDGIVSSTVVRYR